MKGSCYSRSRTTAGSKNWKDETERSTCENARIDEPSKTFGNGRCSRNTTSRMIYATLVYSSFRCITNASRSFFRIDATPVFVEWKENARVAQLSLFTIDTGYRLSATVVRLPYRRNAPKRIVTVWRICQTILFLHVRSFSHLGRSQSQRFALVTMQMTWYSSWVGFW